MHPRTLHRSMLAVTLVLVFAAGAHAETQALRKIPFDIPVNEAIRTECELQTKVPAFLAEYGSGVVLVDELGGEQRLEMAITEVHALGGGAFSGPKWITVQGTLVGGGQTRGTFRAKRFSTGGPFALFKGNCAILGRTTRAVGKDIAAWLVEPRMDALLGDAR